jgi:hypothetical protein
MPAFQDLSGRTFCRLTVLERAPNDAHGHARWLCRCACGNPVTARSYHLKSGQSKSCGCWNREVAKACHTTHGHKANGKTSKEYKAWQDAIKRCYNPKCKQWKRYGGRGIGMWRPFRLSFQTYLAHLRAIGFTGAPGQSVDRIDNDAGYGPDNLRVTDRKGQARNKSNNHRVTAFGKTLCIAEWSERTGIHCQTIRNRLTCYGWTPERALSTRSNPTNHDHHRPRRLLAR